MVVVDATPADAAALRPVRLLDIPDRGVPSSTARWKTNATAHSLCTRPRSCGPCAQAEWFIAVGRAAKKSVQMAGCDVMRGQHRSMPSDSRGNFKTMFVSDGHVVLDIPPIRSNYGGRGASQQVNLRVIAGISAR